MTLDAICRELGTLALSAYPSEAAMWLALELCREVSRAKGHLHEPPEPPPAATEPAATEPDTPTPGKRRRKVTRALAPLLVGAKTTRCELPPPSTARRD